MLGVLTTGANRGLGFEFAAACRDPASGGELQRSAKSAGGKLTIVAMDVTDSESGWNAAIQLKDAVIDVVINDAGITGISGQKTGSVDYDSWTQVLNANTMGPLRVIETFVDHIARSERRLVVTITSGMGSIGDNTSGGSIAYRSSKVAVNMMMRSAAIDFAPRCVICVVVKPGWVRPTWAAPTRR